MPDDTKHEHIHSIWRQHITAQNAHNAKIGPELYTLSLHCTTQLKQGDLLSCLCFAH